MLRPSHPVTAVLALAAACSGEPTVDGSTDTSGEHSSTTDTSTGEPEPEPEPMVPPRPEVQSCRFDGQAPGVLPPLAEVPLFTDASLDEPVDVAPAGPDHLLVAERGGRILAGSVDAGTLAPVADFLKDRGRIVALAPAPDFVTSGHLFVRLEASVPARAVVLRLTVDLATWTADPASERVVIQIGDAVGERSGGALTFDSSGMLIIGIGDLGEQVLPAASDPTDVRGKLLRIDVGPLEDNGTYAIPADNPFVGEGGDADAVWAVGLRDPWRCTPAEAGALWCVDVGESEHEVDHVTGGADLGWPYIEGGTCRLPGGDCSGLNADWPAANYRGGDGDCGLAGALFGVSPGLETSLVYADRCSGRLRGVDTADPGVVVQEELLAAEPAGIVTLARDGRGAPIAVTGDDRLVRLEVAPPPGEFPARLSASGCFADLATLAPVPGVVPYGVNAELWSDGAIKSRFVALPATTTISVGDDGSFEFPTGAVLLKTFTFEFIAGDPGSRRPVETRVMVKRAHGWQFHSYQWDADGRDATLLLDGAEQILALAEQDATVEFEYAWPSRGTCKVCHGFGESRALGPVLVQLNGDHDYGDGTANQLAILSGLGMFAAPLPGPPATLPRIPGRDDPDASMELRARGYLHTNCGHCHRPDGWTPPDLTMDLRWSTPLADTRICDVPTQYDNPWTTGELRVAAGDPEASVIWQRLGQRGPGQMPLLGTNRVDPGASVVRDWIAQLSSCP